MNWEMNLPGEDIAALSVMLRVDIVQANGNSGDSLRRNFNSLHARIVADPELAFSENASEDRIEASCPEYAARDVGLFGIRRECDHVTRREAGRIGVRHGQRRTSAC